MMKMQDGNGMEMGVKEKILRSAAVLFSQKGYHGTTVKDIAMEAGVNKALLFYYFNSKENLYRSILVSIPKMAQTLVQKEIEKASDTLDRFRRAITAYTRFFAETQYFPGIILQSILGLGPDFGISIEEIIQQIRKPLVEVLEMGVREGCFRKMDCNLMAHTLMGMIGVCFRVPPGAEYSEQVIAENIYLTVSNGILAGNKD